ncbi:hypothetical protein Hanom_Chr08g00733461 [Helianthus anomalus]
MWMYVRSLLLKDVVYVFSYVFSRLQCLFCGICSLYSISCGDIMIKTLMFVFGIICKLFKQLSIV